MMILIPSLSDLVSAVLAALSCGQLLHILIPQLRRCLLDKPNSRSSHNQPTARGGGVAFVLVTAFVSLMYLLSGHGEFRLALIPLIALPISTLGFLDDLQNLPATWRYGMQLATALVLIQHSPMTIPWLALPLLLITVTAVINFTNFMDGLDGLVAGCMAVTLTAIAIRLAAPWPIWALVGSLLSFLLFNWSPAKVFMGDVGSTFLGAVFAGLILQTSNWLEAMEILLIATPLLGDACLCVPRRLMAGQKVFQAHRLHLFQRLHQAGWHHARVSCLYISATIVLAIGLLLGGWPWVFGIATVVILIGVWLDQTVAVSFSAASRE